MSSFASPRREDARVFGGGLGGPRRSAAGGGGLGSAQPECREPPRALSQRYRYAGSSVQSVFPRNGFTFTQNRVHVALSCKCCDVLPVLFFFSNSLLSKSTKLLLVFWFSPWERWPAITSYIKNVIIHFILPRNVPKHNIQSVHFIVSMTKLFTAQLSFHFMSHLCL